MRQLFAQDPHAHITDFIDAASESQEIATWLLLLENEPEHMRRIRLAEIKHKMEYSQAPGQHVEIIELMNNSEILQAMNSVIKAVRQSSLSTKAFIKKGDDSQYNLLISLITALPNSP